MILYCNINYLLSGMYVANNKQILPMDPNSPNSLPSLVPVRGTSFFIDKSEDQAKDSLLPRT